jgi:hypothetical protein
MTMFERFSRSARVSVVLAQEEARELNSDEIRPEHLLVGVLQSAGRDLSVVLNGCGLTADTIRERLASADRPDEETFEADAEALRAIGIDLRAVRDAVNRTFGADTFDNALRKSGRRRRRRGHLPFTKPAKKVLELALREALAHKDNWIGSLLGRAVAQAGVTRRQRHRDDHTSIVRPVSRSTGISLPLCRAQSVRTGVAPFRAARRPAVAPPDPPRTTASRASAPTSARRRRQQPLIQHRVRASPSRTASVILPDSLSVGMSRRLLATRTADDSEPIATASASPTQSTRSAWVYCVPSTATRPKNTNTATSPSPR